MGPVEAHGRKLQERLLAAGVPQRAEAYREAERLQRQLYSAELKTRRWRAKLARQRGERQRLEAESRHLAGYL